MASTNNLKVGDHLYEAWLHMKEFKDDDKASLECHQYIVTKIAKGRVHLIRVNRWTYPKGKRASHIPDTYREVLPLDSDFNEKSYYRSEKAAKRSLLPLIKNNIATLKRFQTTIGKL